MSRIATIFRERLLLCPLAPATVLKIPSTGNGAPFSVVYTRKLVRKLLVQLLPGVLKPIRVLWNEIIGFVFLSFSVLTIPSLTRSVREFDGGPESFFRVVLTVLFALMMAGLGLFSFLRARKISRS